jgi:RNA polymerase sigma factor (sigma-70 family)
MDLDYRLFRRMVRDVAAQVSRSYPSYVDSKDTEGALWLWLYEKRESIRKTVEDNPDNWESMIASTLRKVAFDHCAKEKAATEGFDPRDSYNYSLPKIGTLLEVVFEYEDWQSFAMDYDPAPKGKRQSNESGDRLAELADIKQALERLAENHYNVLLWTYKYHLSGDALAVELGISPEAAKKRVQRARDALQRELGRKDPGAEPSASDRRVVRSNAAWGATLSTQYDG